MNAFIKKINERIAPVREQIIHHELFSNISEIEDLKILMESHVFAVWDFMSLLKSLQNNLTCTSIPWYPKGSAETRYLINEIVVGEESDIDLNGKRISHFELYLNAMSESGANVSPIHKLIDSLKSGASLSEALEDSDADNSVKEFVKFTFDIVNSGKDYLQAAVFTFGREDLIPGMFMKIVSELDKKAPGNISIFKYYLERHIEIDGEHHSHLAMQMTSSLCGENPAYWTEAENTIVEALEKRKALWDGVLRKIRSNRTGLVQ